MAFLLGVLAIGLLWLICMIAVPIGVFWLMAPKRPRASTPTPIPAPKPAPTISTPVAPASPVYVRRWGLHRRAWEISEKARWQAEFDRIGK